MARGAIDILEAAYDVDSDETTWLTNLAAMTNRVLGSDRGVIANVYDVCEPARVEISAVEAGTPSGFFDFFLGTSRQLDSSYVRRSYLTATSCAVTSTIPGWNNLPFVKSGELAQFDVADDLILRGWVPSGHGVTLNVFQQRRQSKPGPARLAHLTRIATHLGAAYRLRRQLQAKRTSEDERAEAIFEPSGKVAHAKGPAKDRTARARLREAVKDVERARGRLRSSEAEALRVWHSLVAGRWSLVDELQIGSRRYIVACENTPEVRGPELLTERERQVARFAVAGHSTKLIAYELGISDSTVRVLLSRARAKLKVKTHVELMNVLSQWPLRD